MSRKFVFCRVVCLMAYWATFLSAAHAQNAVNQGMGQARHTGISGLWMLANISYAGMVAQNHPSSGWRILAFLFGLPGTLLTFFLVKEGSGRAYGIHLPKKEI